MARVHGTGVVPVIETRLKKDQAAMITGCFALYRQDRVYGQQVEGVLALVRSEYARICKSSRATSV